MTNPAPSHPSFTRTFNPVFTRKRHDGWTAQKQVGFINALAETACVTEACRAVGMSTESAYALRRRYDAIDFRLTWDHALEYAVHRVADAALERAVHGVVVPHYYKGKIVGEHRRYNETLTMFILRYRTPYTYAKCRDRQEVRSVHPEESSENLAVGIDCILGDESRKYCEANHRAEQAAADKEDDLKILEARREAAYQAYIVAEDAAKAAAAEAAAIADAAMAAAARAARAAPDPAVEVERAASLAGGGGADAPEFGEPEAEAEIADGIAALASDGPDAADGGGALERWRREDAVDVADTAAVDLADTAAMDLADTAAVDLADAMAEDTADSGDRTPARAEAMETRGGGAFRPDVASGSSTSAGDAAMPAGGGASNPGKWDLAALTAAGYRIVSGTAPPQGSRVPYWAERTW